MPTDYNAISDLFVELMTLTVKDTISKLREGNADSKDISNAIKLLKDNGFTLRDVPIEKDPDALLKDLAGALPMISDYGEIIDVQEADE